MFNHFEPGFFFKIFDFNFKQFLPGLENQIHTQSTQKINNPQLFVLLLDYFLNISWNINLIHKSRKLFLVPHLFMISKGGTTNSIDIIMLFTEKK